MYKHIFFDLDHTLWDFERASAETLVELFSHFDIEKQYPTIQFEQFLQAYIPINYALWDKYSAGKIDQKTLRHERFRLTLEQLNIAATSSAIDQMASFYLENCPLKPYTRPFALELLQYLAQEGYVLHIITNGFPEVQHLKLKSASLTHFFDYIITSAEAKAQKPHKAIFQYALRRTGAKVKQSLMIGDSWEADIVGAQNVQMDHVFYNPEQIPHNRPVHQEVACLSHLMSSL